MKYSEILLKKFISINDNPENIADKLILKTCEIEEIQKRLISDSIVIGYVTKCYKHPDADKLNVCEVNCGDKGEYQIICGGSNVREGIFVPVALPGTHFEKVGITIEKRKMRGIESNGMICSKEEVGINEDMELHSIWDLAQDFDDVNQNDLGIALNKKYPRLETYVMDVDNKGLTNRPDLTGHFGVAVELNSMYNTVESKNISFNKIKDYMKQFQDTDIMEILNNSKKSNRKILNKTEMLNSYILIELNNIQVKQSDFFTRLQIIDLGSNPINNRVDFSNLFMNISGQPVHFFDAEKVDGDIIVRNAQEGEKFIDLFEKEHILKSSDMVIADKKKILALAGVVGGLDSGVTEKTQNILVEIANFDPVVVRKTGTRLGLRTDAELRYEKNINPLYSLYCLILFLDELKYYSKDLGSFEIGGLDYFVDQKPAGSADRSKIESLKSKEVKIDYQKMEKFIFGKEVENFENDAKSILKGLGFIVDKNSLNVPIWRGPEDINIAEDIYEEVARIYGYEKIENAPVIKTMENIEYGDYVGLQRKIEDILVKNLRFDQVETYPWIGDKVLGNFELDKDNLYSLQNPVVPDCPWMRDSMVYNLLSLAAKNSKFFDEFKMFDIGRIRKKCENLPGGSQVGNLKGEIEDDNYASNLVGEIGEVGMIIYKKDINNRNEDPILEAKNFVDIIFKELGIDIKIIYQKTSNNSYHPKKQADIFYIDNEEKKKVGFIGSLHPVILKSYKISENASMVYLGLNLEVLLDMLSNAGEINYSYETLQDQIVYRDLCFVIDEDKEFDEILDVVKTIKEIDGIEVFDLYKGNNLPEGKKSIAFKIKISGENMTTEQINEVMNKAIKAGEKIGAVLRS